MLPLDFLPAPPLTFTKRAQMAANAIIHVWLGALALRSMALTRDVRRERQRAEEEALKTVISKWRRSGGLRRMRLLWLLRSPSQPVRLKRGSYALYMFLAAAPLVPNLLWPAERKTSRPSGRFVIFSILGGLPFLAAAFVGSPGYRFLVPGRLRCLATGFFWFAMLMPAFVLLAPLMVAHQSVRGLLESDEEYARRYRYSRPGGWRQARDSSDE